MNKLTNYIRHPLNNLSIISNKFLQSRLKSDDKSEIKKDADKVSSKTKNADTLKKLNLLLQQNSEDKSEIKKDADQLSSKTKNADALKKLNLLLQDIVENNTVVDRSNIQLAKPKSRKNVEQQFKKDGVDPQKFENDIATSIKNVAEAVGGNISQTESELLSKLLNPIDASNANKQAISPNLSDIVKGMKIDRTVKSAEDLSRAQQVRDILQVMKKSGSTTPKDSRSPRKYVQNIKQTDYSERDKIDLFGKEPLGIFSDVNNFTNECMNETWHTLHERELRLAITHPPANYFQEMILWTEQGKLWKFPIDNEQGMEAEKKIYFTEHVFLEKHLEPWCPPKGPIRHFMELVCVGLSKNPYMSVEHKREHIAWFRDYFQDKQKLLEEVGAIPHDFVMNKDVKKDIQN